MNEDILIAILIIKTISKLIITIDKERITLQKLCVDDDLKGDMEGNKK
jgi:hypothetical protein